jgi:hypothetical protein
VLLLPIGSGLEHLCGEYLPAVPSDHQCVKQSSTVSSTVLLRLTRPAHLSHVLAEEMLVEKVTIFKERDPSL